MPGHRRNRRSRPDRPKLPLPPQTAPVDRAWADFSDAFRTEVLPKLLSSGGSLSVFSGPDDISVQGATEVGYTLLLGRPLILVVTPGVSVPQRLRAVAHVVLDDWDAASLDAQERLSAALREIRDEGPT